MRNLSFLLLLLPAIMGGSIFAQNTGIGANSVSVSTTPEGNVTWNANVDGHNRKGYIDRNSSLDACNSKAVDADVIIPTTTYFYPNQATDILFFSGNGTDTYSITILDAQGKVLATKESKDDYSMDISAFDDGIYTLQMKRGVNGKTYTKKIVKE